MDASARVSRLGEGTGTVMEDGTDNHTTVLIDVEGS